MVTIVVKKLTSYYTYSNSIHDKFDKSLNVGDPSCQVFFLLWPPLPPYPFLLYSFILLVSSSFLHVYTVISAVLPDDVGKVMVYVEQSLEMVQKEVSL